MILEPKILSLGFVIEYWWFNTLTRENNWFLKVLVKSNFATPTPFGSISCFVVGICLILTLICSYYIKRPIQMATGDILCMGKYWEASEK